MSDIPVPGPDRLDELLMATPPPQHTQQWRQTLLGQTTRVLRRRRRWKRLGFIAALAACYAAGALTVWLMMKPAPVEDSPPLVVSRPQDAIPERAPKPPPDDLPRAQDADLSARALEWQAVESEDKRAELFRRAGDRYLNDENDPESALRCYKNALNAGADTKVSPDDNWLLASIKNARQKEKRHGQNDG
jgi:hypothetical protein